MVALAVAISVLIAAASIWIRCHHCCVCASGSAVVFVFVCVCYKWLLLFLLPQVISRYRNTFDGFDLAFHELVSVHPLPLHHLLSRPSQFPLDPTAALGSVNGKPPSPVPQPPSRQVSFHGTAPPPPPLPILTRGTSSSRTVELTGPNAGTGSGDAGDANGPSTPTTRKASTSRKAILRAMLKRAIDRTVCLSRDQWLQFFVVLRPEVRTIRVHAYIARGVG